MKLIKVTKSLIFLTILITLISTNLCSLQYLYENPGKINKSVLGFLKKKGKPPSQSCFIAEEIIGDQQSEINFTQSSSSEEVTDAFGGSVSINAGAGLFEAEGSMEFLKDIQEDSSSLSINYYQKVSHKVRYFYGYGKEILNEDGITSFNGGQFESECGDSLVRSRTKYAGLIFSIKLTFNSRNEKNSFKASASARYGKFLSASIDIENDCKKLNMNASLEIYAKQIGGRKLGLTGIFSGVTDHSDGKVTKKCTLEKIEDCSKLLKDMMKYANNDFPTQFKNKSEEEDGLFNKMGGSEETEDLILFDLSKKMEFVSPDLWNYRRDIEGRYRKLSYYVKELNNYIYKFNTELNHNYNYMEKLLKTADDDLKTLKENGMNLYNLKNDKKPIREQYKEIVEKLQENLIEKIDDAMEHSKYYDYYSIPWTVGCEKRLKKEDQDIRKIDMRGKCRDLVIKVFDFKNENGQNLKLINFSIDYYSSHELKAYYSDLIKISARIKDHRQKYEFTINIKERTGNKINAVIDSYSYTRRKLIGERKIFNGYFRYPK